MENVKFTDATREVGKPKKWDVDLDGPIISVSVHDYVDVQTGLPFMLTGWRPSADELAILNNGGYIALHIAGDGFPVMLIEAVEQG